MISEQQILAGLVASVALICVELTDDELIALNLVATLDGNPQGRLFDYQKVKPLFTEHNGKRMHSATKDALAALVKQRAEG